MTDKKKKKSEEDHEIIRKEGEAQQGLTMEQILAHPVVRQMNQKIEEMRQMVQGIPEAVGRGVAEAMRDLDRKRIPKGAVGPPVPLKQFPGGGSVEFHKGGKVIERPAADELKKDEPEKKQGEA